MATSINMEREIRMLIELQALDTEIFEKKKVLDETPAKLKELDVLLESKSGNLKAIEEELKNIQLQHKEKEGELATKEEAIKKDQVKLLQIKTNKEYAALQKEIATIKADSSVLEEEIIGLLEQIDEAQKKISEEKSLFEVEKKKIAEEKKKVEDEKKANETGFDDLKNKRNDFAVKVDKNILTTYEKILNNREGLALVRIAGGACGGCNMNLPPQVENEAKLKQNLTFCGNCARILYAE